MTTLLTVGIRIIILMYGYALTMHTADYAMCQFRTPGECGQKNAEAVTVAMGAASTWFAYLSKSPLDGPARSSRARGNARADDPPSTEPFDRH